MRDEDDPKLRALIEGATEAIAANRWDDAVAGLRRAVKSSRQPETVAAGKGNLAAVLYSRALRTSEEAMGRINEATEKATEGQIKARVGWAVRSRHRRSWKLWLVLAALITPVAWWTYGLYEPDEVWIDPFWTRIGSVGMMTALVVLLLRWGLVWLLEWVSDSTDRVVSYGNTPPCWVCGNDAGYRLDVPGHGERILCHEHANRLENAMSGLTAENKGVKMLRSARKDLTEAAELDPALPQATEALTQVRDVLRRLGRS